MVAAAFLHDVVEDTEVTINEVAGTFGVIVSELVEELTDPARYILGPKYRTTYRAERKEITKKWLASCSRAAQIIKLIDRIDNLREMPLHSRSKYHTLYTKESLLLAEAIGSADPDLKEELKQICYDYSFYTSH